MAVSQLDVSDAALADIAAALGVLPESFWDTNDDACDCTYVRIGMWTNPYLAETLEVRWCCIWAEMFKLFPQFVRVTPAWLDQNAKAWEPEPRAWDGEDEMPASLWYRQLSRFSGDSVGTVRALYSNRDDERPRGTPRPPMPEEEGIDPIALLFEMMDGLAQEVGKLRGMMEKGE